MEEQKNPKQSPEDQLDALLEQFLADPTDKLPIQEEPQAPSLEDTQWLDDILAAPQAMPEIGPDEQALASTGLIRPEDAELEDIIRQTQQEDWEAATMVIGGVSAEEPFLDQETRDAFDEGKTLTEIFSGEATLSPAPEPAPKAPTEKVAPIQEEGMPKKKHTYGLFGLPHLASTLILVVLVALIGSALGQFLWACAVDVLAFGREDNAVTITVTKDDTLNSITEKLQKTGLIEYPGLFKLYAKLTDAMDKIDVGIYELNTLYDYHALVLMMQGTANRVTVEVRIPEGATCAQIFDLLQEKGVCTVAELEAAAAEGELAEYWFLEGLERGSKYCLEGYLFPDTYEFYVGDTATRVLNKLLTNFENRFTDNMAEKLNSLNATLAQILAARGFSAEYIEENKMTMHKVVIVASMIEKETASVKESYTISSVIYNRLTNPGSFPYLNIDATLVYITGKSEITAEDKLLDTPYNTYVHKGLIPGPISNPSRSSLDAALDPETTSYYYYALDPDTNRHHFSSTYDEHQAFLESIKDKE